MLVLEEGPDCPCGATGAKSHPNYSPSGITCHRLTGFLIGSAGVFALSFNVFKAWPLPQVDASDGGFAFSGPAGFSCCFLSDYSISCNPNIGLGLTHPGALDRKAGCVLRCDAKFTYNMREK